MPGFGRPGALLAARIALTMQKASKQQRKRPHRSPFARLRLRCRIVIAGNNLNAEDILWKPAADAYVAGHNNRL
jgi:hypothetical protein